MLISASLLAMAMGTSLKCKLDDLSKQIFEIDLKIQTFAQQNKQQEVSNLKAAKVQLQKNIVDLQIQYELKKAQNKKRN